MEVSLALNRLPSVGAQSASLCAFLSEDDDIWKGKSKD